MKGALMDIYGEILIMVLMLILFFLLLTSVFSGFGGNEPNVVRLNAELLRSKMAEACTVGKASIEKFTFPQAAPYPTQVHWLADVPGFLAKAYIKLSGDPKYVIYYETFPIGEGVGWEVYHDFDYRIIAPFDYSRASGRDLQTIGFEEFEKYLYKGDRNTRSYVDRVLEGAGKQGIGPFSSAQISSSPGSGLPVIANNIMLTSELNPVPNQEPKPFSPGKVSRSGDWKDKQTDGNIKAAGGDNTFEFSSYDLLSALEQTTLKYRSCGKNALCLKTTASVERLELPKTCNNEELQYVQLEYDNRAVLKANVAVGGVAITVAACTIVTRGSCLTIPAKYINKIAGGIFRLPIAGTLAKLGIANIFGKAAAGFLQAFLASKSSDFYLAAPCAINNIEIEKVGCNQIACSRWLKYPLYEVVVDTKGERKYVNAGDHYQCVDNIEGSEKLPENKDKPSGACLKVKIKTSPGGFCWTADPTKKISNSLLEKFTDAQTQFVANTIGFTPVRSSALYMQDPPAIALKPTSEAQRLLTTLVDFIERRYAWGWPGSFGESVAPVDTSGIDIENYQLPI